MPTVSHQVHPTSSPHPSPHIALAEQSVSPYVQAMDNGTESRSFIIDRETVLRKKAEREDARREAVRLQDVADKIDAWLAAAQMVVGEDAWGFLTQGLHDPTDDNPEVEQPANKSESTGTAPRPPLICLIENMDLLSQGMSESELFEFARDDPETQDLAPDIHSFRNVISKAVNRGRVRRKSGFLYSPELWSKIESGEIQDREDGPQQTDVKAQIMRALAELGPSTNSQIVARLRTYEALRPRLRANPSYPGNLLSRLALDGTLNRTEGVYSIPVKE